MQRQAAFISKAKPLKGALHCHTTRSDGVGSPEEVIKKHVANGYDFMAITDHWYYNYKNFAPGENILIVPGVENAHSLYGEGIHCFHTVCIGPSAEDGNGYGQEFKSETGRVTDQFEYQRILDEYHANKNMTIYCHPEWSGTPARDFDHLTGNFAMEIWNSGCALEHEMDTNAAYWDELLMQNKIIYGVASDDGHRMHQHCVGWVMVSAKPELNAILDSLKNGAFYSSCGPEITDFYIDGKTAVLECSPCEKIYFHYGRYPTRIARNEDGPISRAEFTVPDYYRYLRASVMDFNGKRAWTNPIFIK